MRFCDHSIIVSRLSVCVWHKLETPRKASQSVQITIYNTLGGELCSVHEIHAHLIRTRTLIIVYLIKRRAKRFTGLGLSVTLML